MRTRPDMLVLGAGGVLGEAWMSGALAGIAAAHELDFTRCEYFVGTSAGAILAARLAAGIEPTPPAPVPRQPDGDQQGSGEHPLLESVARSGFEALTTVAGPWIRLGLGATEPVGAFARATALRALPTGTQEHDALRRELSKLAAGFDGRLRIVAVNRDSGERIVFGSPGAPEVSVAEAVIASCSMPTRFAPHAAADLELVDGGVWSPTNLDAAPAHRGAQVLCLSPTASAHGPLHPALRAGSAAITLLEVAAARSAGVEVELITPDRRSATAIGRDPMAPAPAEAVRAAGYQQGLSI